jgi:hypothetical protein
MIPANVGNGDMISPMAIHCCYGRCAHRVNEKRANERHKTSKRLNSLLPPHHEKLLSFYQLWQQGIDNVHLES